MRSSMKPVNVGSRYFSSFLGGPFTSTPGRMIDALRTRVCVNSLTPLTASSRYSLGPVAITESAACLLIRRPAEVRKSVFRGHRARRPGRRTVGGSTRLQSRSTGTCGVHPGDDHGRSPETAGAVKHGHLAGKGAASWSPHVRGHPNFNPKRWIDEFLFAVYSLRLLSCPRRLELTLGGGRFLGSNPVPRYRDRSFFDLWWRSSWGAKRRMVREIKFLPECGHELLPVDPQTGARVLNSFVGWMVRHDPGLHWPRSRHQQALSESYFLALCAASRRRSS